MDMQVRVAGVQQTPARRQAEKEGFAAEGGTGSRTAVKKRVPREV